MKQPSTAFRVIPVLGVLAFLAMLGAQPAWGQGNSAAAHWCAANFPAAQRGQCVSQAAHGRGPFVQCGPSSTTGQLICGSVCCPAGDSCVARACATPTPTATPTATPTPTSTPTNTPTPCGATAITIEYTGPRISGLVTVTITGGQPVSTLATYTLPGGLNTFDVLTSAGQNGYTVETLTSVLGSQTTVKIEGNFGTQTEILNTDCSCMANPSVNLVVGAPMCLDAGSHDNSPDLICTAFGTPDSCCADFDSGTCTAHVCTGTNSPLFCCTGPDAYSACTGAESPLWALVARRF
jgi:hypothetical protein